MLLPRFPPAIRRALLAILTGLFLLNACLIWYRLTHSTYFARSA